MQHDPLDAAARRSQWILDIEHDLRLIALRLNALEDHFEDDGLVAEIIQVVRQLALRIAALEPARHVDDDNAER